MASQMKEIVVWVHLRSMVPTFELQRRLDVDDSPDAFKWRLATSYSTSWTKHVTGWFKKYGHLAKHDKST